jgi:MFS transporter, ACDE family, multidrug resistance protein
VAPYMAGRLGEKSVHLPFWVGAVSVLAGVAVLLSGRAYLRGVDHELEPAGSLEEAEAVTVGS